MDKQKLKSTALGGLTQNPVFVLVLGMCPVIGTSTLESGLILGLATMAVLVFSNLLISLLRKLIPDKVRIPCYIVVIATLVTLVDLFLGHFMSPDSYDKIATYVALIVVNCIVLGRAEAFASKNNPLYSALDGLSMGLGFTVVLSIYGGLRELLSSGRLWGASVFGSGYVGIEIFGSTPGGFILLGLLMALFNAVYAVIKKKALRKQSERAKLEAALMQNVFSDADGAAEKTEADTVVSGVSLGTASKEPASAYAEPVPESAPVPMQGAVQACPSTRAKSAPVKTASKSSAKKKMGTAAKKAAGSAKKSTANSTKKSSVSGAGKSTATRSGTKKPTGSATAHPVQPQAETAAAIEPTEPETKEDI